MFEIVIRNKRIIIKILNRNSVLRWVQFREPYLEVVQNSGEKKFSNRLMVDVCSAYMQKFNFNFDPICEKKT